MGCGLPTLRLRREKLLLVGRTVFGTDDAARAWLKAANANLDGLTPEALTDTLDGFQRALAELESLAASRR
jgi:hypothetical protein